MAHLRSNARTAACIASGDQTRHMVPLRAQPPVNGGPVTDDGQTWEWYDERSVTPPDEPRFATLRCPWTKGDVLWLREPVLLIGISPGGQCTLRYASDGRQALGQWPKRLERRPIVGNRLSNGCIREFARFECEVLSVGAQRFKDITEEEAQREGVDPGCYTRSPHGNPRYCYKTGLRDVLESIYGSPLPEWWWWWCTFETRRI